LIRVNSLPVCIDGVRNDSCAAAARMSSTAGRVEVDPHRLAGACRTTAPYLESSADTDAMVSRETTAEVTSNSCWRFAGTVHRNAYPDEALADVVPPGSDEPNHGHKQRRKREHPELDGSGRP
jgi:hypothetical protein